MNKNANAYAVFGCIRVLNILEEANKVLGSPLVREASGEDLLRRPEMTYDILTSLTPYKPAMEDREAVEQVEIAIKYQGYIEHQQEEIEKQKTPRKYGNSG